MFDGQVEKSDQDDNRSDKLSLLIEKYENRFGIPHGGCFLCGGPHFKRHCPLRSDLKL